MDYGDNFGYPGEPKREWLEDGEPQNEGPQDASPHGPDPEFMEFLKSLMSDPSESDVIDGGGSRERSDPVVKQDTSSLDTRTVLELMDEHASNPQWDHVTSCITGEVNESYTELESGPERDIIKNGVKKMRNAICKLHNLTIHVDNRASNFSLPSHISGNSSLRSQISGDFTEIGIHLREVLEIFKGAVNDISVGELSLSERHGACANRAKLQLEGVWRALKGSFIPVEAVINKLCKERDSDSLGNIDLTGRISADPSSSTTLPGSQAS